MIIQIYLGDGSMEGLKTGNYSFLLALVINWQGDHLLSEKRYRLGKTSLILFMYIEEKILPQFSTGKGCLEMMWDLQSWGVSKPSWRRP